jgi:small subunit ribosomal protein S20
MPSAGTADDTEREVELGMGGDEIHCGDCYTPSLTRRGGVAVRLPSEVDKGFTVANSRSARKRIRSNERKRLRNRTVRSAVRTKITRVRRSLVAGQSENIEEELRAAVKALDKAAEKGILHRRNAARRKSRITSMAARLIRAGRSEAEQAQVRVAAAGGAKGKSGRPASTRAKSATARASNPRTRAKAGDATAAPKRVTKAKA